MATHTFELLFLTPDLGPDISHVYIKSSGSIHYADVSDELELITSQCVSIREFEAEINRLKSELDEILNKARQKYTANV